MTSRFRVFSEFIMELDKKEHEEKRKHKRLQERKNREAYRQLLKEKIENGTLNHNTSWRDFLGEIKNDERFLNMVIAMKN